MNTTIKIKVTNALTDEVVIDSQIEVKNDYDTIIANRRAYEKQFPDCHVNFTWDDGKSFIGGMPYNMAADEIAVDEGRMTFNDYVQKWYGIEEMKDDEVEVSFGEISFE